MTVAAISAETTAAAILAPIALAPVRGTADGDHAVTTAEPAP